MSEFKSVNGVRALLTVDQTAEVLQVSRASLYRLFASGALRYVQVGAHRRVSAAEIERFIAANTQGQVAEVPPD
ncbi:helix-turn-helix domain-containing protein [Mycolicibacterium sp. 141076]|uniref:helix-turn-helix domain-containing protein n=1 Tax=Mycobacteriaceae TaxID=1762 RepID=UPI00299E0FD5|nr:helix-turn-helix domain-containing protein [Mycolicibacterium sp. 141076]MDX1880079.1 helix-turn-helix domain-containing protein [Mycolicibacterium sp. 141076]